MKAIFSCQICERWRSTGYLSQLRARLRDWALRPVRAGCYPWAALPFIDSKTLYRRLRAWAISALAQATEGYMNPAARLQARGRLFTFDARSLILNVEMIKDHAWSSQIPHAHLAAHAIRAPLWSDYYCADIWHGAMGFRCRVFVSPRYMDLSHQTFPK